MSFEDGWAAIHLETPPRVPRTEYSAAEHWELVRAVTGWHTSLHELLLVGQRRLNLMRAFNAREGFTHEDDALPAKCFVPLQGGATDGVSIGVEEFETARTQYYQLAGWTEKGIPTPARLAQLGLSWATEYLPA